MARHPRATQVRWSVVTVAVLGLWSAGSAPAGARGDETLYLVYFEGPPLARTWRQQGLSGRAGAPGRFDPHTPAARAALRAIDAHQRRHIESIERRIGRPVEVRFRYRAAGNAAGLFLTRAEAAVVEELPGVREVAADLVLPAATDRTPSFLAAPDIWDGSGVPGGAGTYGEGAVVGILDSGIEPGHPAFAAVSGDGYIHVNPLGSGNFLGVCDPDDPGFDPSFLCNDKLIGAWDYEGGDGPWDDHGHGSHVAGIAVGNPRGAEGPSGVAPRANLLVYDVCADSLGTVSCSTSASMAAVEQAILDGVVDVLNYSITGGFDPWSLTDIDHSLLDAVAAGIFVATAAGNQGVVHHLGPWLASVASTTHDRETVESTLTDFEGGIEPPPPLVGATRTGGYGPAPVVKAADFGDGNCTAPFPADTWNGQIVYCDSTNIPRLLACAHVAAGGAGACIVGTSFFTTSTPAPEDHVLPAVSVGWDERNDLVNWLTQGSDHASRFTAGEPVLNPDLADHMADTSGQGPNPDFDLVKPDLAAPGVDVFSAWRTTSDLIGYEMRAISGTSMASPHVAGAAALLRVLRPDWSPAELLSVLSTTGATDLVDGLTDANPHDYGGGRINLAVAAGAGLVLDETVPAFVAADPNQGGEPSALNLPGLATRDCPGICSWHRTVTSARQGAVAWTASDESPPWMSIQTEPAVFELSGPSATRELEITVRLFEGAPVDIRWAFGRVVLTPDDPTTSTAHLTVAVFPTDVCESCPVLAFEPASLDFGDVEVGMPSPPRTATLRNTSTVAATGVAFTLTDGGFDADTGDCGDILPAGGGCTLSITMTPVEPGPADASLAASGSEGASALLSLTGNGVGDGFTPIALAVDPDELISDGNGVFEAGESVTVAPVWRNSSGVAQSLLGTAAAFIGTAGATYTLTTDDADYGTLAPGATGDCAVNETCYRMGVSAPDVRPAMHWEATFEETLSDETVKTWTLHIGDSFTDVPRSNLFYRSIETLLHSGVTGCSAGEYCPAGSNTRAQMAVFLLRAVEDGDYAPPACVEGEELFLDVTFDHIFCPWIEELAGRGVTSGCGGGGNYCPGSSVTRAQMAIFLLKTLVGAGYEPPACTERFIDVPCPSLFADWIEDLAARGVTSGCSETEYCPGAPVTRAQMATFVTRTFGLTLYGP